MQETGIPTRVLTGYKSRHSCIADRFTRSQEAAFGLSYYVLLVHGLPSTLFTYQQDR